MSISADGQFDLISYSTLLSFIIIIVNAHLTYNATFLHAISDIFKPLIQYQDLHFRASNEVPFMQHISYYSLRERSLLL